MEDEFVAGVVSIASWRLRNLMPRSASPVTVRLRTGRHTIAARQARSEMVRCRPP
jgi:hypothetical protein